MTPWGSWLAWEKSVGYLSLFLGGALTAVCLLGSLLSLASYSFLRPEMAGEYAFLAISAIPAVFIAFTFFNTIAHVPVLIFWGTKKIFAKKA